MMNLPYVQRKVIDDLDIRFKTISDWIYFVSYKKGYKPYQLDEDEVALLTETYENLYMVLEAVKDGKLNPDIEQAEGIVRRYNSENDTWEMFVKEIPEAEKEFPSVMLEDQDLKDELKNKKQIDLEVMYSENVLSIICFLCLMIFPLAV